MKRTTVIWPLLAGIAVVAGGCATTIPATDDTPPRVELTLTGPGIGTRTMSNPPRGSWTGAGGAQLFDLQPRSRYSFRLAVSDSGGVARAHLRMPVGLTVSNLAAGVTEETDTLLRRLTLLGNRDDPRTGQVIAGFLETPRSGGLSFEFQAEGDDFGGTAARRNQTVLNVATAIAIP